jgi:type VI secretion system VasD/TssJ family lipoprotein
VKKSLAIPILLLSFLTIVSCATGPVAPTQWRYEKEAINLTFQADPKLNLYNGRPHTLQVCVYQLKNPNGFNQLAESQDGLYNLLECVMFDASVVNFRSVILRPGQTLSFAMDRAEGARYIGLAAGYAKIEKDRITRLLSIPEVIVTEGGLFKRRRVSKAAPVKEVVHLGSYQIETVTPGE